MGKTRSEKGMNPDYESQTECKDGEFCACHHLDGGLCDLCSDLGCEKDE